MGTRYHRPKQGYSALLRGRRRRGLIDEFQQKADAANAANEQRYQQVLTGYDDLHKRAMSTLDSVGSEERRDIDRRFNNQSAATYQTLVNRGFGNSNLPHVMSSGIERDRSSAHTRLSDQLARTRLGFDSSITQGKLGVIERRHDNGPDMNQLYQIASRLGASGYGQRGIGGMAGGPKMFGLNIDMPYQMAFFNARNRFMMPFMQGAARQNMMYQSLRNSAKQRLDAANARRIERYR